MKISKSPFLDLNITWNGASPSGATMSTVKSIVMGSQMREELEKRILQYLSRNDKV